MNKLVIITGFLGKQGNRFMQYQDARSSTERLELAAKVEGCDGVELGYPEDFEDPKATKQRVDALGLGLSGVNFRSRRPNKWYRGSWTTQSAEERREVIDDFKRAMDLAAEGFAEVAAHNPDLRICIEYKENEPRGRCLLGSAGETISFCQMVGADNLGLTLDLGHSLLCGERPAQAAAMAARAGRLFYVQLNDNDGRFDWDLLPGAFRMWDTVELLFYLKRLGYDDDWYTFDVTPKEKDPVETFSQVFSLTRKLEEITDRINTNAMSGMLEQRDPNKTTPYLYSLL